MKCYKLIQILDLYSYPTYHSQKIDDRILVYIEIPGVKKRKLSINL